jgi:hypothetical protein
VVDLLAGYVRARAIAEDIDGYIVPPALGEGAGVFGALALAHGALALAHDALARHRSQASTAE